MTQDDAIQNTITPPLLDDDHQVEELNAIFEHALRAEEGWNDGEISKCYRRDPDDDRNVPIGDEVGLCQLLSQRFKARKQQKFAQVEELEVRLKHEHGVRAYDNPNVWTRQYKPPAAYLRRKTRKLAEAMKSTFGPMGHPYTQVGGPVDSMTCPLSSTDMHALLSRVQQCRMKGSHEEADAVEFELNLNGVKISERTKSWRADGKKTFEMKEQAHRSPAVSPTYTEHTLSTPGPNVRTQMFRRVEQLVSLRAEALVLGESGAAQLLELELYKAYGVGVDDESSTFSFGAAFANLVEWQPPNLFPGDIASREPISFPSLVFKPEISDYGTDAYKFAGCSESIPSSLPQRRIEDLLLERLSKREERKFCEADFILKELYAAYDVKIDDKTRAWMVSED